MTDQSPHPAFEAVTDGIIMIDGVPHMADGRGAKIPLSMIKDTDKLIDQTVRTILGFANPLSDQVARFKQHTFDDIGALEALLAEKYGARLGGAKGNKTLTSHDTLFKVTVQVADNIAFGPELQVAKGLIDECLNEWAAGARDEIRTIVTRAFNTDKEGQINRAEVFMLLRLEISDDRWRRAMEAIRDAMRVVGSKTYVRCYRRRDIDAAWEPVTIDLAKA
ncbi:sulfate transporter [Gemmobacter nanjingensis]|uniref:Sulfate transporter n=1 Tax=Gemmobacter nanjingensis TaxID=488454 RepID=A0ABQ3FFP2_9RHOB|nr:DUF3164 family protein [Gemmobacter nanjingensis]GHC22465.1 sulfate transporter [Gemmobacter nanjingensis]